MISIAATPRRFWRLASALPLALLLTLVLGPTPAGAETRGIELSFDDGPDGSDDNPTTGQPLKNTASEGTDGQPFDDSGPQLQITFEGSAARTYIDDTDALYGRAAEFFGGSTDAIKITSLYTTFDTPTLYSWWYLDDSDDELFAAKFGPDTDSKFDFDPEYCGEDVGTDTVCDEYVATADADDLEQFGWDVPVRCKVIYDDTVCTGTDKCRVVFALSGGGACADNYPRQDDSQRRRTSERPARSGVRAQSVGPRRARRL